MLQNIMMKAPESKLLMIMFSLMRSWCLLIVSKLYCGFLTFLFELSISYIYNNYHITCCFASKNLSYYQNLFLFLEYINFLPSPPSRWPPYGEALAIHMANTPKSSYNSCHDSDISENLITSEYLDIEAI